MPELNEGDNMIDIVLATKLNGGDFEHATEIAKQLNQLYASEETYSGKIVIAVGDDGISKLTAKGFSTEEENKANYAETIQGANYVHWSAHQLSQANAQQLFQLVKSGVVHHVSLPAGEIKRYANFMKQLQQLGCNITEMVAVPVHVYTDEELKGFYDSFDAAPELDGGKEYVVVSLPGDAPDPEGRMQDFTKESAEELIQHLVNQHQGKHILLENSPRTGNSESNGGCKHTIKAGENIANSLDDVTKYFTARLEAENIAHTLYPFAFVVGEDGKRSVLSAHKALLYFAKQTGAAWVVPGESTTAIAEAFMNFANSTQITVFQPSSANPAHKGVLNAAYEKGLLCKIENGELQSPPAENELEHRVSDAELVACTIKESIKQKKPEVAKAVGF
jgi:hypothetical protein